MKQSSSSVWMAIVAGLLLVVPLILSLAVVLGFRSYQVGGFDSQIARWTVPASILSILIFAIAGGRSKSKTRKLAFFATALAVLTSLMLVFQAGVVVL